MLPWFGSKPETYISRKTLIAPMNYPFPNQAVIKHSKELNPLLPPDQISASSYHVQNINQEDSSNSNL